MKVSFTYKNLGFTLAEILIVIAIIGTVSVIALSIITNNSQDAQLKSAWKKAYSTFSEAAERIKNDNGGTLNGAWANDHHAMMKVFGKYVYYSKTCDSLNSVDVDNICWHETSKAFWWTKPEKTSTFMYSTYYGHAVTNNGWLLQFYSGTPTDLDNNYGTIDVDVNGFKGPNTVGKDIFEMRFYSDKSRPTGWDQPPICTYNNNYYNLYCSNYLLYN